MKVHIYKIIACLCQIKTHLENNWKQGSTLHMKKICLRGTMCIKMWWIWHSVNMWRVVSENVLHVSFTLVPSAKTQLDEIRSVIKSLWFLHMLFIMIILKNKHNFYEVKKYSRQKSENLTQGKKIYIFSLKVQVTIVCKSGIINTMRLWK